MTSSLVGVVAVVAVSMLAGVEAAAQSAARSSPPQERPAPASAAPQTAAPGAPAQPQADFLTSFDRDTLTAEYRIAPGDVLQVFVWREAELTREVRVRPDGYVTCR